MPKIDEAYIEIKADVSKLKSDMNRLKGDLTKTGNESGKEFSSVFSKALNFAAIAVAAEQVFSFLKSSVEASIAQARAVAKIEQALKTTGNAAQITSKELQKMAANLQQITGIDDDTILTNVTGQLLTFGNIAGDVFKRTQQAVLDVNTVISDGAVGSLVGQAIMLGKAMNDPLLGLTAMRRVGIAFSKDQDELVKTYVKQGKLIEAQKLMLTEIEKQYGGQAAALNGVSGGLKNLEADWGDLKEQIGKGLLPIVQTLVGWLDKAVKGWQALFTVGKSFEGSQERQAAYFESIRNYSQDALNTEREIVNYYVNEYELLLKNKDLKKEERNILTAQLAAYRDQQTVLTNIDNLKKAPKKTGGGLQTDLFDDFKKQKADLQDVNILLKGKNLIEAERNLLLEKRKTLSQDIYKYEHPDTPVNVLPKQKFYGDKGTYKDINKNLPYKAGMQSPSYLSPKDNTIVDKQMEAIKKETDEAKSSAESYAQALSSGLVQGISAGQSLEQVFKNLVGQMIAMVAQALIFKAIMAVINSAGAVAGSVTPSITTGGGVAIAPTPSMSQSSNAMLNKIETLSNRVMSLSMATIQSGGKQAPIYLVMDGKIMGEAVTERQNDFNRSNIKVSR